VDIFRKIFKLIDFTFLSGFNSSRYQIKRSFFFGLKGAFAREEAAASKTRLPRGRSEKCPSVLTKKCGAPASTTVPTVYVGASRCPHTRQRSLRHVCMQGVRGVERLPAPAPEEHTQRSAGVEHLLAPAPEDQMKGSATRRRITRIVRQCGVRSHSQGRGRRRGALTLGKH